MSYTVLARKYRPQSFDDLVGQEHVAKTLANAIAQNRVAHAFLFTGVRGVGKTTSARLLAKCLNCQNGPTAQPCNACDACNEITNGVDIDVLEMDGASNNSVDDVRRLQESIPFRPARDRFKIVIVDEVHMLSTGAFNAFLKTLEEPPPHVKFIFATTEAHKVPITIRSRCQRYDFRLIPQSVVKERIKTVLAAEKIRADDAAIAIVAREAAGSMRDALTLLDQIVAFGGDSLKGEDVAKSLGLADRKLVHDAMQAVLAGDGKRVLEVVDVIATQGLDLLHFAKQLLGLARNLVVVRVLGVHDDALGELVDEEREEAKKLSASADALELQRVFASVAKLVDEVARATAPRMVLEMALVRAATRPPLRQLSDVLARLEELEGKLVGASAGRSMMPSASRPASREAAARPSKAKPSGPSEEEGPYLPPSMMPMAAQPGSAPKAPIPPPIPAVSQRPPSVTTERWTDIVAKLLESKPALGAVMQHGAATSVSGDKIELVFPTGSFFGQQATTPESKEALMDAAAAVLGSRPSIEVQFSNNAATAGPTVAQLTAQKTAANREAQKKEALSHPGVVEALQVFPESAGKVDVNVDGD